MCPFPKIIYVITSYFLGLKLQNYSSECSSCAFFRKIKEKLFWVIEAINKARATNSIMNLIHTLYVITDAKAYCSILHSSGNIQIKSCWGSSGPLCPLPLPPSPSVTFSWQKLNIQRVKKTRKSNSFSWVLASCFFEKTSSSLPNVVL